LSSGRAVATPRAWFRQNAMLSKHNESYLLLPENA
jgi:hypothetical protein